MNMAFYIPQEDSSGGILGNISHRALLTVVDFLAKPVAGHATSGPFGLADPTPLDLAFGAGHVHASPVPLGRGPALGTGLGRHPDGHPRTQRVRVAAAAVPS